ncbi:epsin-3 [Nannizzia gypsea CBS 118893]|uniref:Epsin-3 n=1 Tax=Arthroderma gypseum (strain ATCC MYA-4604 / CBS 118893) TaxID=535722 RepID=E4UNZ5_ARTGP|nr:epsin-3 [Nannizzia gypsea CBS 118893]EFQ99748.1 epsin-3 [Nannizzia gypsea CBS 118893]
MDFNSLKDQVSNLSLYDIKAGVRKVQNAMMNYTEMEAKVREATNNEPWGASSTLMQEIANGTHSYQLLNEIMPMIYKRFTEKSAEEWRQIYKSLQLLEFLVKNGSERVVDDARSHISLLRMLRQFHYIDPNGKDQGINIRNRSQELAKLLGDVDMIRAERKKAKANRNKFGGFEGGMGVGMSSGGGSSRFGGFGSEDAHYGGFSGGVYGDGGGFNGNTSEFRDASRRSNRFEEYDEGDSSGYSAPRREQTSSRPESKPAPPKAPTPDLVSFGDDEPVAAPPVSSPPAKASSTTKPAGSNGLTALAAESMDDDEFDDFQSASPATNNTLQSQFGSIAPPSAPTQTQFAAPKPVSAAQNASLNGLAAFRSNPQTPSATGTMSQSSSMGPLSPTTQSQPPKPTAYQASQPNYFTSIPTPQSKPSEPSNKSATKPQTTGSSKSGGDAFGNLWSTASANAGIKSTTQTQNKGPNLASMAKEKASAGIWGAPSSSSSPQTLGGTSNSQQQKKPSGGSALDDLLG